MIFTFFSPADKVLFSRQDAESATWTQEEMSLQALFPYDESKVIQRGQRIGFVDDLGTFQAFEIRKVRSYEPDHYQEVIAEHIVISELTDEFHDQTDYDEMTASAVLSDLLTGTLWSVGTDATVNTSTAHIGMGNIWADIRTVEKNWNVYILPRVTVGAAGITGRYLDIIPAGGIWRGVRLSLDKNLDEVGVTWDDSNVKTALYGFGASVDVEGQEEQAPLTFADEVWTATADHPAKPADQTYIEDPAATAAYGRNGRPRFGFYQNGDIDDPALLLEKTWEALQSVSSPDVTVDCMVRDLHRLGYADQPLRLHDTALVEIRPTGVVLALEIIKLTVDLLDPTATRPTIGTYIPNIVYIAKETNDRASGGGGGSGGQTNAEYEISEFQTEIAANKYQISLRAYQVDLNDVESILAQAGLSLNAQGVLVYADDNVNMWQSKLNVQADRISLVVTGSGANAQVNPASIVAAVNAQTGSFVQIRANTIDLSGYVTASQLSAELANINIQISDGITTDVLMANDVYALDYLQVGSNSASWQSTYVVTGINLRLVSFEDGAGNDQVLRVFQTDNSFTGKTIYYLGRT